MGDAAVPVIEQEWLTELEAIFVDPPEFAMAKAVLERKHVVILQGLSRCGKTSLGARLLQSLNIAAPHCVYTLSELPKQLSGQAGYLVDDLGAKEAGQLDVPAVRELGERARAAKSYVVLTVDDEVPLTRAAAALLVPCALPPDARKVLKKGLDAHFGDWFPEGLERLAGEPWVRDFLDTQPLPGAVRQLVDALATTGADGLRAADAKERFDRVRAQEVVEWFKRYPSLKDRCFIVSAAVFQGSSLEWIDLAARLLEDSIGGRGRTSDHAAESWRLLSPRERRLRAIGACLRRETRQTATGLVPTLVVRFASDWLPGAILRHVWEEHDDARNGLVAWLKDLAVEEGEDGGVQVRAAVPLGVLGREDMGWLSQPVQQWVQSRRPSAWDAAGIAFAAYARDPDHAEHVAKLLHRRVTEDPASPRSAVTAVIYGLLPSEPFVSQAPDDLRAVLAASSGRIGIVTRSLMLLAENGQADTVLEALWEWRQGGVPGAVDVFCGLAEQEGVATGAWQDGHPLLLSVAEGHKDRRRRVAQLWRAAWRDGSRQERRLRRRRLQRLLRRWLDYVQAHPFGRRTLDEVIDLLAADGASWRLLVWMDEWATASREPSIAGEYRRRLASGNPLALPAVHVYRTVAGAARPLGGVIRDQAERGPRAPAR